MNTVDATCSSCGQPFPWLTGEPRICWECKTMRESKDNTSTALEQAEEILYEARLDHLWKLLNSDGGFTCDSEAYPHNGTGYAVALSGWELKTKRDFLSREKFNELFEVYADASRDRHFVGTWVEGNLVVFDLVEVVDSRETAIRLGKERNQKAIYDFEEQRTIYLD